MQEKGRRHAARYWLLGGATRFGFHNGPRWNCVVLGAIYVRLVFYLMLVSIKLDYKTSVK